MKLTQAQDGAGGYTVVDDDCNVPERSDRRRDLVRMMESGGVGSAPARRTGGRRKKGPARAESTATKRAGG